ncbi:hypothetical protein M2165_003903 [Variovorax sp. TBS-050B]|nr:hypothetical protein [Variovorax sp. TBS-050B]
MKRFIPPALPPAPPAGVPMNRANFLRLAAALPMAAAVNAVAQQQPPATPMNTRPIPSTQEDPARDRLRHLDRLRPPPR